MIEPRIRPYCTFEAGGLWLGVDVAEVSEVIRSRPESRVPNAPGVVRGLIGLRGQVVTVLDLRRRLGRGPSVDPDPDRGMDVVVRSPGGAVGLAVDAVGEVLEVDEGRLEPTPSAIPEPIRSLAPSLYPLPGRPLLRLDLARVIDLGGPGR